MLALYLCKRATGEAAAELQRRVRVWAEASTYGIEDIRVPGVEQVGQPLLYRPDHLGPHGVYQEIITGHRVSSVTDPTQADTSHTRVFFTNEDG